jgi:CRP-like cAMP-binding protein
MSISEINIAETEAEKQEIYRLRYQLYIEEMNGGSRHTEANAAARQLRDESDQDAIQFYGRQDGELMICARTNIRGVHPLECEDQLEMRNFGSAFPNQVTLSSRLALHPKLQGSFVLKRVLCRMYQFWREHEIRFDFIDCHPRLLPLYSRLGWRLYKPGFKHPKYTYVIPMVLVLDDLEHLEQVRSPFTSIARNFPHSTNGRELLLSKYPAAEDTLLSSDLDTKAFWELLRRRIMENTATAERPGLFMGMSEEDIHLLTTVGHIVKVQEPDTVVGFGESGREVFVILDGSFHVLTNTGPGQADKTIIKLLGPGDVFGEIAFLTEGIRCASVAAAEEATILVLNAKALDRLAKVSPKVAVQFFRNLARIIAVRLRDSLKI